MAQLAVATQLAPILERIISDPNTRADILSAVKNSQNFSIKALESVGKTTLKFFLGLAIFIAVIAIGFMIFLLLKKRKKRCRD